MRKTIVLLALLFGSFLSTGVRAQGIVEKVTDLMEFNLGKPPADSNKFQAKLVLAPIAYFEPNTSFGFGFGTNFLFKPKGSGRDTRVSVIPVSTSYTLNNQVFITSAYTVFFPEEKWLLRGNLDYSDFPLGYYGIGNGSPDNARSEITFQQLLVEPLLLRQVSKSLFLGGGFRYNNYYNTELIEATAELPEGTSLQDSLGSRNVGLEFAASYDSRDNLINAQRGVLAEFTQGVYGRVLGGTSSFQLSKLDLRAYRRLNDRSVLGFQFYGRYANSEAPIQELSSLGGEERLRGFAEFRFRDRFALFTQAEYRYQAFESIGFVVFGGAGQVADGARDLGVGQLRYSLGTGLRVAVIPSENVNLRIDYGLGLGLSNDTGFYIGLGEAF